VGGELGQDTSRSCRCAPALAVCAALRGSVPWCPCFAVATDKPEAQLGFQEEKDQVEQKSRKVSDSQVGWLLSVSPLGSLLVACLAARGAPRGRGKAGLIWCGRFT